MGIRKTFPPESEGYYLILQSRNIILGVFDMPEFDAKGPEDPAGDEIEGLACFNYMNQELIVLFGERGGSGAYTHGKMRWAEANLRNYELKWRNVGRTGVAVNAPGHWTNDSKNRDISGLHIDEDNNLWATASEELGITDRSTLLFTK